MLALRLTSMHWRRPWSDGSSPINSWPPASFGQSHEPILLSQCKDRPSAAHENGSLAPLLLKSKVRSSSVGAPIVEPPIATFGSHYPSLRNPLIVVPICIQFLHFFCRHQSHDCMFSYCYVCSCIPVVSPHEFHSCFSLCLLRFALPFVHVALVL